MATGSSPHAQGTPFLETIVTITRFDCQRAHRIVARPDPAVNGRNGGVSAKHARSPSRCCGEAASGLSLSDVMAGGPEMDEPVAAFPMSFHPSHKAVKLLAEIANANLHGYSTRAAEILEDWRDSLATPAHIAMVQTSDELEIDDHGACISSSDRGFFIQAWVWVEGRPESGPDLDVLDGGLFTDEEE